MNVINQTWLKLGENLVSSNTVNWATPIELYYRKVEKLNIT